MAATTSSVYIHVIEDVVDKVRDEFTNVGGPGEDVLNELQALWELKMMQCSAICGPIERSSLPKTVASGTINPVHDLNVPYEGTEEYETPTAEILFPPTPIQTPIQTPLPGTVDTSIYPLPTGHNDFPTVHDSGGITEAKPGRPSPYMQPPSPWMNQRPLGVDVNIAYVEGRDEMDRGTSDQPTTQDFFRAPTGKRKREDYAQHFHNGGYIPQQDGPGDATSDFFQTELYPYQGVTSEDYNTVNTPANQDLQAGTPTVGTHTEVGDDDDEPPLNENDDDDLDDVDEEEEPNTQHLVLAQFDKVTRTKSRWKCTLKDGIMHINNKDILFTKATGEFDF